MRRTRYAEVPRRVLTTLLVLAVAGLLTPVDLITARAQVLAGAVGSYAPTWNPDTPISLNLIAPAADIRVQPGATVTCQATAEDIDKRTDGYSTTLHPDSCTYDWWADGGTFDSTTAATVVWTAPTVPGTYYIDLQVDDQNDANRPSGEGGTRDDSVAQRTVTVHVGVAWSPHTPIESSGITAPVAGTRVGTGAVVQCSAAAATDVDSRSDGSNATYPADTCTYSWSATGGTFSGGGQNVAWTAPATAGVYTITLTVDDQNDANKPQGEAGTRDDTSVSYEVQVYVGAAWEPYTAIQGSGITAPLAGALVAPSSQVVCTTPTATDDDRRTASGGTTIEPDTCSYSWTADGGTFSGVGPSVTWTAPAAPGAYTITLSIDDQNNANLPAGEGGSRDDPSVDYRTTVYVYAGYWDVDTPIESGIEIPQSPPQVSTGSLLNCQALLASDQDARTAPPDTVTYHADTCTYQWSADGGTFTGTGRSVEWTAPTTSGTYTITLRVDDQNDANKPTGEGGSRDDPAVEYKLQVRVVSPGNWDVFTPISQGGIETPPNGVTKAGSELLCRALSATDLDLFDDSQGTVVQVADDCTYTWSATGGSFLNNVTTGQEVTWIAPIDVEDPEGVAHTVTLTIEDRNDANKPMSHGGTRNDPSVSYSVEIKVFPDGEWHWQAPEGSYPPEFLAGPSFSGEDYRAPGGGDVRCAGIVSPASRTRLLPGQRNVTFRSASAIDYDTFRISRAGVVIKQEARRDLVNYSWYLHTPYGVTLTLANRSRSTSVTMPQLPTAPGTYILELQVDDAWDVPAGLEPSIIGEEDRDDPGALRFYRKLYICNVPHLTNWRIDKVENQAGSEYDGYRPLKPGRLRFHYDFNTDDPLRPNKKFLEGFIAELVTYENMSTSLAPIRVRPDGTVPGTNKVSPFRDWWLTGNPISPGGDLPAGVRSHMWSVKVKVADEHKPALRPNLSDESGLNQTPKPYAQDSFSAVQQYYWQCAICMRGDGHWQSIPSAVASGRITREVTYNREARRWIYRVSKQGHSAKYELP